MAGDLQVTRDLQEWVDSYSSLAGELRDDPVAAQVRLRCGVFTGHAPSAGCRPPSLPPDQQWLRVRRLARAVDGQRPVLVDVLSSIARLRVPVVLAVLGGGAGLHLGLPAGGAEAGWIRSVLAPGSLLEPVPHPLPLAPGHTVNGLRFRLVPGPSTEAGATTTTGIPGLARLLLAPGRDWAVVFRLDPVSPSPAAQLRDALASCWAVLGAQGSTTRTDNPRHSVSIEQPGVAHLLAQVTALRSHLEIGESAGLWHTAVHVIGPNEATTNMITSAVASLLVEEPCSGGRWIGVPLRSGAAEQPPPATLLATSDLTSLLTPPLESVTGLEIAPPPPSGRVALTHSRPLELGEWSGTSQRFALDVADLEGHGFVTGTTGSGKSHTVQRLLAQLWNQHDVPFLVIDPVKADYDRLAPALSGGLLVVDAADLRMNVLLPIEGFGVRTHLELVSTAFTGSFGLPSPVPYVVAQLFDLLVDRADAEPAPTLHELRDLLDPFVASLGYDAQVSSNIRAALGTRLGLLLSPAKAERVAAPTNDMLDALFRGPAVVALGSIGDDEERAFLMTMLTLHGFERARMRGDVTGVRHVTVLEEAHRVLPEPRSGSDPEAGDAASVSARLLTQLLAEIRSYGESILVVDQSPASVARDVVRNTNLKITHRVLDPDDRAVVAGSMGIDPEQADSIGLLGRGEAVVHTRRLPGPQTILVARRVTAAVPAGVVRRPAPPETDADARRCCSGEAPARHHAAERLSREAEGVMALVVAGLVVDAGRNPALWEETGRGLGALVERDPRLVRDRARGRRCLAWVGLRRTLVQYVDHGSVHPDQLGKLLDVGFGCWQRSTGHAVFSTTLRQEREQAAGSFDGCRHCDAVCLFRHVAAVSEPFGLARAVAATDGMWATRDRTGPAALRRWADDAAAELRDIVGKRYALSLTLCTLTQYLHRRPGPEPEQDLLLVRQIRTDS